MGFRVATCLITGLFLVRGTYLAFAVFLAWGEELSILEESLAAFEVLTVLQILWLFFVRGGLRNTLNNGIAGTFGISWNKV